MLIAFLILCTVFYNTANAQERAIADTPKTTQQTSIDSSIATVLRIYLTNPVKARLLAQNALLISKQINYQHGVANSFLAMGITYWAQSYYPISLFYLNSALSTFDKNDHDSRSDCYRSIGRNYVDLRKYEQGLLYIKLALSEAGENLEKQERAISERAYAYMKLGEHDKAITDVYTAIKLCRAIHKPNDVAILYGRLCNIYINKKDYTKAGAYCDTAYLLSLRTQNKRLRTTIWISRAAIAHNQHNYTEAIKHALIGFKMADSLGILELSTFASRRLYWAYEASGNKDLALAYQKKYIITQDSLNKQDKQNSLQLIQEYFSLNHKLHDIEQIELKNTSNNALIRSQRNTIFSLLAAVMLLIIALYAGYRYYRQKQKLAKILKNQHQELLIQNRLIESQSNDLDELNQLKDRLLAIIGHDLKSPLANVRSIVDLFGQGYFTLEEFQLLMKDIAPAIEGAELTLSNLVEWAGSQIKGNSITLTTVDLLLVTSEIANIFKHPLSQKDIQLLIEVPAGQYLHADENHVKMILRNLMSNAIKFTPAKGLITISVANQGHKLVVSVNDTGKGMSAEEVSMLFSATTHFTKAGTKGEKGTGIGLLLCHQLAQLNDGEITVTSAAGVGSTFYLTLPSVKYQLQA